MDAGGERLLPQPGGFKGLRPFRVGHPTYELALVRAEDLKARQRLEAAKPKPRTPGFEIVTDTTRVESPGVIGGPRQPCLRGPNAPRMRRGQGFEPILDRSGFDRYLPCTATRFRNRSTGFGCRLTRFRNHSTGLDVGDVLMHQVYAVAVFIEIFAHDLRRA
jgi:hypothetical protein